MNNMIPFFQIHYNYPQSVEIIKINQLMNIPQSLPHLFVSYQHYQYKTNLQYFLLII